MRATVARYGRPVVAAAVLAAIVAALGASATDLGPWYQSLRKPPWQPPDWLFGPAWTLIFALIALAGAIAWTNARGRDARLRILAAFALNGLLNVLWSELFFRLQRPGWALAEVVLFWLSILLLIVVTVPSSRVAGLLLLPYLAWVAFAGTLNLAVVRLNHG